MTCGACGRAVVPARLYCDACGARVARFIGREREMELLSGGLEDALSGRGRVVLLSGQPGIGKTHTAEELASRARHRGARVLWGRCRESEGAPAFWPWSQMVRAALRGRGRDWVVSSMGGGASVIAQVVGEVREHLPDLPAPPALEPGQARFRLFDSVATFLMTVSVRDPLVLLLDDLQCADTPSLVLLEFVAEALSSARILMVGTYRDTELGRGHPLLATVGRLARQPHARRLPLRGLAEEDVARLVELITGRAASRALAAALCRQTDGNPFFVGELARLLDEEGRLDAGDVSAGSLSVPLGVREVIARRLNDLSPECTRVLELASVIGREFDLTVLARLAGLGAAPLLDVLQQARDAHVVTEASRAPGRYAFAHALIREALYADILAARRVPLHRQVAELLAELYAAQPEPHLAELAYHFGEAAAAGGAVDKAIDYAGRAAARATEQLAYEESALQYRRAERLLDLRDADDPVVRCDLLLARGEAETRAGDLAEARKTLLRAADLARAAGMRERLARAALGLGASAGGFMDFGTGSLDETLVGVLEESIATLPPDDGALRARLLARLGQVTCWSTVPGRRAAGRLVAQEAVAMARRLDDPALELAVLASWADWHPDNLDERLASATRMIQLSERSGHREMAMRGYMKRVICLLDRGELAAADRDIEELSQLAAELRQPLLRWQAQLFRATRATMAGRFDDAERELQAMLVVGERMHENIARHFFTAQMVIIRREQGRLGEIVGEIERFAELTTGVPAWACGVTFAYAELGRRAEARRKFERLASGDFLDLPRDMNWLLALAMLARTCALLRDTRRAELLYTLLLPYARRNVYANVFDGNVSLYLGLLAATMSRWDAAVAHYEEALESHGRMGVHPFVAHTQHEYAATLLARGDPGDRERAFALLAGAVDKARELGMIPLLGRATALREGARASGPLVAQTATSDVFRREADCWTLTYGGTVLRLRDTKGLRYIAHLLRHPGQGFDPRELVRAGGGDADGSEIERARLMVTKSIRRTLRKIDAGNPRLARHLGAAIRTGYVCAYRPPPGRPVPWGL